MDPAAIASQLASHGVLGLMLVIVIYGYWSKDKALRDESAARISDAKSFNDLALKLQQQTIDSVNKLADVLSEMKKLMAAQPPNNRFGGGR